MITEVGPARLLEDHFGREFAFAMYTFLFFENTKSSQADSRRRARLEVASPRSPQNSNSQSCSCEGPQKVQAKVVQLTRPQKLPEGILFASSEAQEAIRDFYEFCNNSYLY